MNDSHYDEKAMHDLLKATRLALGHKCREYSEAAVACDLCASAFCSGFSFV